MKKNILLAFAIAVLAMVGCQKVDLGEKKLQVSAETIELPKDGGEQVITLTATVDWAVRGYTDEVKSWLSISPESGKAAAGEQTITIKASANDGKDRSVAITFFGDVLRQAELVVKQAGSVASGNGTAESPYNAAEANAVASALAADAKSEVEVYVKGIISNVKECSAQFGNATFNISDDGKEDSEQFLVYRIKYFNGAKMPSDNAVKVGDEVVVKGLLINFKGNTPELNQGGSIVTLNDKTEDTGGQGGDTPVVPTEQPSLTKISIKEFLEKPVNTTDWYELTGEIISIEGAAYGNITIKDETGEVYIYGVTSKWIGVKNDQSFASLNLKVTDTITIGTKRDEYNGAPQGGGNDIAAFYISHIAGEGQSFPAGTVILTFPDDNKEAVSAYDKTWTAKIGASEFSITAFNNNKWDGWTYIRCGRKANDSVASIATKTPMPKLSKVTMAVDNNYCPESVNSVILNVYSDAAMTSPVAQGIEVDGGFGTGEKLFIIPAEKQAENLYYEIVFDLKKDQRATPKNGLIQISKVVYVAAE